MNWSSKRRRRSWQAYRAHRSGLGRRLLLIGAMVAVLAATGIGAVSAWDYMAGQLAFDEISGCYSDAVAHESALFGDFSFTTDSSVIQERSLRTGMLRAYDALPPNGRLSVFSTARDTSHPLAEPVFSVCRPPEKPAEQERIGAPAEPPAYLTRRSKKARAAYLEKVEEFMAGARNPEKRAYDSPILEQLRAISKYDFGTPLQRLYLYTDGLENTKKARFCKIKGHLPPFYRFQEKTLYRRVKPAESFSGIDVTFWMVETARLPSPSLRYCTTEELRVWWEAYFEAAGATVDLIELRYGAAG